MFAEGNEEVFARVADSRDPLSDAEGRPVPRTWTMRLARAARHLQKITALAHGCATVFDTLLLTKRPAWVDRGIIGLRTAAAVTTALDDRVNAEVRRAGVACWPCFDILIAALTPYYVGTYYRDVHWYRVPLPRGAVDVVLSSVSRHTLYVVGTDADRDEVIDFAWRSWMPVAEVHPDPFDVRAGAPLQTGFAHPLAVQLDADLKDGVRKAVFLLGSPGTGKSHVAEQTAGLVAARGRGRVLRLPDAAGCKTQTIVGLVEMLRPDAVVIHDIDTDAFKSAVLLRFTEALAKLGVVLICTANSKDGMHAAAFGEHRLGAPVIVETAPVGVLLDVLSRDVHERVNAWIDEDESRKRPERTWVWPAVFALPLSRVDKLRKHIEAGYLVPSALRACGVTEPTCASPAAET